MATVDMRPGNKAPQILTKGSASTYGVPVRVVKKLLDLQAAVVQKGSVLATGDIIRVIPIPNGSGIMRAGARVLEAAKDASGVAVSQLAFGLGTTAATTQYFGITVGDGTVVTYPIPVDIGTMIVNVSPTGTLSIVVTLGTYSGTALASGVIGVWAIVADVGEFGQFNIAKTDQAGVPQA